MADIEDAAFELGYQATVGKVSFNDLTGSKVTVVVFINLGGQNHFVVFRGVAVGCVFLADPLRGNLRITESSVQNRWRENAVLVVVASGETQSAGPSSRLSLLDFTDAA
jgi:predicted double-glycine peptidase